MNKERNLNNEHAILSCVNLNKIYHEALASVSVLKNIELAIHPGERIAIVGPSGSGKSTLLHLLGGLDQPSEGQVMVQGVSWQKLSEKARCKLRNQSLGFVYQFHHLLPEFTALENVMMPLLLGKIHVKIAEDKAAHLLKNVGLAERLNHKPAQLSGGERQRVAIARALVHEPRCILADEPTGNLDSTTASQVFELMLSLNQRSKTALVMVTHDAQLAKKMDKVLSLQNGELSRLE